MTRHVQQAVFGAIFYAVYLEYDSVSIGLIPAKKVFQKKKYTHVNIHRLREFAYERARSLGVPHWRIL